MTKIIFLECIITPEPNISCSGEGLFEKLSGLFSEDDLFPVLKLLYSQERMTNYRSTFCIYSTVYGYTEYGNSCPNTEKPGREYGCRDMITSHSFDLLRINTDQSRGSTLYKELSFHIIKCKLI
jgi:hypothetical protein